MALNKKNVITAIMLLGMMFVMMFQLKAFADSDFAIVDGVLTRYEGSDKNVIIPDGVTEIASRAFNGCYEGVETVVVPAGVTKIGEAAFNNCQSLKKITLPDGLLSIGEFAFMGCEKLESIVVPNSVTSIGNHAFNRCHSLKTAALSKGLTSLAEGVFYDCTALTKVIINTGVTNIGRGCFFGCKNLLYVDFPSTLKVIEIAAFSGCSGLEIISLPKSLETISWVAFLDCDGLKEVYFEGTADQWSNVLVRQDTNEFEYFEENGNKAITNAKKTFNTKTIYFNDVLSNNRYVEYVTYLYDKGAMTGKNETTFDLNGLLKREETVSLLWKNEGSPSTAGLKNPFTDIKSGWYYDAVVWAKNQGIVDGKTATTFVRGEITRQEFIKIMYGFAQYKGYSTEVESDSSYLAVEDANTVSSWARVQMNWGYENGLIGQGSNLRPKENIKRKDAAAIFARFLQKFE